MVAVYPYATLRHSVITSYLEAYSKHQRGGSSNRGKYKRKLERRRKHL